MGSDYFVNHGRADRFPWSLYHQPIERDLLRFLGSVASGAVEPEVLVIGCGLCQELDRAPPTLRLTAVDIDGRAIDALSARHDPRVRRAVVVSPDQSLTTLGQTFDAIYAKEVIEHIGPWRAYLADLRSLLRDGGKLWLSTPNYGEPWLPLLERTFLEVVARASGFTRAGMHPSKLSRRALACALTEAQFTTVDVRPTSLRLALVARAEAGVATREVAPRAVNMQPSTR